MFCEIDLYLDRRWQRVATAEALSATEAQRGYQGRTHLSYDFDYVADGPQALGATDVRAVSCRYPVSFELHSESTFACRWRDAERLGMPDWGKVAEEMGAFGVDVRHLRADLADFAQAVERLDDTMAACGVDDALIERLTGRVAEVAASLRAARPHPGRS